MTTLLKKSPTLDSGFLVDGANKLVSNPAYEAAQLAAHKAVLLASKVTAVLNSGQSFKFVSPASMEDLMAQVLRETGTPTKTPYMTVPTRPGQTVTDSMRKEADEFFDWVKETAYVEKFNAEMAQYDIINRMEKGGVAFTEGVLSVNLEKVYTIDEIKAAVTVYLSATKA
jgi:hypothetical protein